MNWKVETLKAASTMCLVRLLKISWILKKKLPCLLIKISWLELIQTRFLIPYVFANKPLSFARRLLDRQKEEGVGVFQAFLSSPSLISKALV